MGREVGGRGSGREAGVREWGGSCRVEREVVSGEGGKVGR